MNKISEIFCTLFYVGKFKFFPGTIGSIVSLIIIFFLEQKLSNLLFIILFFIIFFLSLYFINLYSKKINKYDSSEIVIDEFIGIYVIFIFCSYYNLLNNYYLFLIFIFFRLFDIFKIYPANWVDNNVKNSFGVILDDIIAGIYTIITIFLINGII